MRKINLTLFIYLVLNLLGVSSVSFGQTTEELQAYSKAQGDFYQDAFEKGFPSLKGAGGSNPSIADSYCSETGQVDITPDNLPANAAIVTWQIRTVVGGAEYHPDWGMLLVVVALLSCNFILIEWNLSISEKEYILIIISMILDILRLWLDLIILLFIKHLHCLI
ncbi:hypothetical protein JCM21142_83274 [Saccharicrinis fermentans DSM 9555 = JCM 21142]|uniref:Uncharacterized protein n=1 Tax=Saccharicrinis fermentans DSM 9555 = JCM 21142 TaxID=869213 RepID=W7Y0W6_9BACT|nr:hypothetical protein JCM21142_83274 [Saccharicrinis fermentans DSM 9555 = JCM 21142]